MMIMMTIIGAGRLQPAIILNFFALFSEATALPILVVKLMVKRSAFCVTHVVMVIVVGHGHGPDVFVRANNCICLPIQKVLSVPKTKSTGRSGQVILSTVGTSIIKLIFKIGPLLISIGIGIGIRGI